MGNHMNQNSRYPKINIQSYGINHLALRNPYTIMWWSAALPGFGHVSMGKLLTGTFFILWEFFVNWKAGINTAIIYSFTGRFHLAIEVLDLRFTTLYVIVYFFVIWDARRICIELNRFAALALRRDESIPKLNMAGLEVNYIEYRSPWITALWTVILPGLGHFSTNQLILGLYGVLGSLVIGILSNVFYSLHFLALGDVSSSTAVLDPFWFMFIPSIYGFMIYDGYINTKRYREIFGLELERHFKIQYQSAEFDLDSFFGKEE